MDSQTIDTMPDEDTLFDLAELFKIFGDSSRIKILFALFEKEMAVNELSAFLSEQNAVPVETPLLSADGNNFPFNITVEFKADEAQNRTELYKQQDFRTDFIISFTVEEALRHKEYISAITKASSEVHKKCTVRIAFTYGDYSRLQIPDKITGTEVLLESIMNKNRTSAICRF